MLDIRGPARHALRNVAPAVSAGAVTGSAIAAAASTGYAERVRDQARSGEYCLPGKGEPTPGGGATVSHRGWPYNNGVYWKV
jgi:hypothetical protein